MRLGFTTKMVATTLTIAAVAVPTATAGGVPEGFDFRVAPQSQAYWPEGQPALGGTGIGIDARSTFPEGQPAPGGDGRVVNGSYWPEGQPAPGGIRTETTPDASPYTVPVGFDFKAPANWIEAPQSTPVSLPTPGGFDYTDAVIGAAVALGAALLTAVAVRRRGGLAHS